MFDEAIVRYGEEVDYTHESELLCDYLVQQKWISHTIKPLVLSEYGAFVEKSDPIAFLMRENGSALSRIIMNFSVGRIFLQSSSYVL